MVLYTIDDYNKVMIRYGEETQQVKRIDMINGTQNEVSEKQQIDTGEELIKEPLVVYRLMLIKS